MNFINFFTLILISLALVITGPACATTPIGQEKAVPNHLQDGSEYTLPLLNLLKHGELLFKARWTTQDGAGRPMTKGTGAPLSDGFEPLFFPRNMNRISGPDANSCAGCHNTPWPGGGGEFVTNVFTLRQRFDFATFDPADITPTKGVVDENGLPTTLQGMGNSRSTLGMFGSGYIEMLARQITARLQALRDGLAPGQSVNLLVNGIDFGKLSHLPNGTWDTSQVTGLPPPSLRTTGANDPPSLLILPFHQAGAVVSLRQFTNNALNHHHGIQTTERFGQEMDADQDVVSNEMTRADTTALSVYQATLPVPGRVIPANPDVEKAVILGEDKFVAVGCSNCHIPALPLVNGGWM